MKGYITILAVLVLLVVTGGIATALLFSSTDTIMAQESLRRGDQALFFSESCLEEGLLRIVRDPAYTGGSFAMPQGVCAVTVENDGADHIVHATGNNAEFERSVVAAATLDPMAGLSVTDWKEE